MTDEQQLTSHGGQLPANIVNRYSKLILSNAADAPITLCVDVQLEPFECRIYRS
jgi:hypothetical protein